MSLKSCPVALPACGLFCLHLELWPGPTAHTGSLMPSTLCSPWATLHASVVLRHWHSPIATWSWPGFWTWNPFRLPFDIKFLIILQDAVQPAFPRSTGRISCYKTVGLHTWLWIRITWEEFSKSGCWAFIPHLLIQCCGGGTRHVCFIESPQSQSPCWRGMATFALISSSQLTIGFHIFLNFSILKMPTYLYHTSRAWFRGSSLTYLIYLFKTWCLQSSHPIKGLKRKFGEMTNEFGETVSSWWGSPVKLWSYSMWGQLKHTFLENK